MLNGQMLKDWYRLLVSDFSATDHPGSQPGACRDRPSVCRSKASRYSTQKKTPPVVTEDPGPVLPSEREAGATAVCVEATRPVERVEALTSPQSRAGKPAAVGEELREPGGA
jgi:hypothetical protein